MRLTIYLFVIFVFFSCSNEQEKGNGLDSKSILNNSKAFHDPNNAWEKASFMIHIQEPRVGNPQIYSIVKLNNVDDSFALIRNRET
ncbi:MAG: hypothetical protein AAGK97_17015, partial [Bacteroidota bacterium]